MTIQITVMRITGYGPWTLELGSDREHELQILQASLYGRVQRLMADRGCLAFMNRADEYFAVTNGLGVEGHAEVQRGIRDGFDLPVEMSVGVGDTPYGANIAAAQARRSGAAADREHGIYGGGGETAAAGAGTEATVLHMDVEGLTSASAEMSPYDVTGTVVSLYARMSRYFALRGGMTFFMGGDNFMVVANGAAAREDAEGFVEEVRKVSWYRRHGPDDGGVELPGMDLKEFGVRLNCGVGRAAGGREAAARATGALDAIRGMRDAGDADRPFVYELP